MWLFPRKVKLASCKYLDGLPVSGNAMGRAFRDLDWEARVWRPLMAPVSF